MIFLLNLIFNFLLKQDDAILFLQTYMKPLL